MLKLTLTLPFILSALHISFTEAQNYGFPPCAASCATAAGSQTGCNITIPTPATCLCTNEPFVKLFLPCVLSNCSTTDTQEAQKYWVTSCFA